MSEITEQDIAHLRSLCISDKQISTTEIRTAIKPFIVRLRELGELTIKNRVEEWPIPKR